MNWLAKINLNTIVVRLGAFRSALLLIVLIVICVYSGYRIGNFYHGYQIKTLAQQKTRLDILYDKHVEQTSRINTLEVELEVEHMANRRSQKLLKTMEKQHYQVKKEFGPIAPDRHLITVYQSRSHKKYTGTAVFNEDNLSEEFTYADIIEMLANDIKGMLADDNIHS